MQSKVSDNYVEFFFPTITEPKLKICLFLKHWRIIAGLTQSELARLSYTSKNAISSYENGEYCPTLASLCYLANALHIHVESLYCQTIISE